MVYYNCTKGPLMLYVREPDGYAVSVEIKAKGRWECPDECVVLNAGPFLSKGDLKERKE